MEWLAGETAKRKVFVLPAFETAHLPELDAAYQLAAAAAIADKTTLAALDQQSKVYQFAKYRFHFVSAGESRPQPNVFADS
jgi:hypothetical protein